MPTQAAVEIVPERAVPRNLYQIKCLVMNYHVHLFYAPISTKMELSIYIFFKICLLVNSSLFFKKRKIQFFFEVWSVIPFKEFLQLLFESKLYGM